MVADDATDLVVMLDARERPVATVDPDGRVHSALQPGMRVRVDTPVAEAAERAITRPTRQRFHPLVCVDDHGRYVGVVRMERVLTYLTAPHRGGLSGLLSRASDRAGTVGSVTTGPEQSSPRVLVVDDDRAVRESLRRSLEFNGYAVSLASDGAEALASIAGQLPDALVIDVMMPRLDGIETTRALRSTGNDLPILVLTARDSVGDRVEGLDAGADDYLTKPFALEELLARLRALLRRVSTPGDGSPDGFDDEVVTFSDLSLNLATREVRRGDRAIELTRTEFALLEMFLRRPRRVLDRSFILEEVWGYDFPTTANSLEVYVGYLRRKTEAEGEPRLIHTVRGVGYVLKES